MKYKQLLVFGALVLGMTNALAFTVDDPIRTKPVVVSSGDTYGMLFGIHERAETIQLVDELDSVAGITDNADLPVPEKS